MTDRDLARKPALSTALRTQVTSVVQAMRWETRLLIAALGLVSAAAIYEGAQGNSLNYPFEAALLIAIAAVGLPFAIWKGERVFNKSYLLSLPVDRPTHAWIKVIAGIAWLWAATFVVIATLSLVTLLTGGSLDGSVSRPLMATGGEPALPMQMPVWMALVPFGGGLVAYLFSTAVVIGVRHKLLWAIGAPAIVLALLVVFGDLFAEELIETALVGPVGLDFVVSGGFEALEDRQSARTGETLSAWRRPPQVSDWLGATALWSALGSACVALAARRHREH